MAISGSLNFLSASITGSETIKVDFVGLNTLILEPITASINMMGHVSESADSHTATSRGTYYNSDFEAIGGPDSNQLNSLLLNRNGPYQHPTWKQIRGGNHPIARTLRLNNTMSIDKTWPQKREVLSSRLLNMFSYEDGNRSLEAENAVLGVMKEPRTLVPELAQFYEPSVVSKFKPFLYSVLIGEGPVPRAMVRTTLMNETSYFYSDELNLKLKTKVPNLLETEKSSYTKDSHIRKVFVTPSAFGAGGFIYSESIFPKGINARLPYKLEKTSYEESPGSGSLGYDKNSSIIRSFWRDSQGGGLHFEDTQLSGGASRLRTDGVPGLDLVAHRTGRLTDGALNSLGQQQVTMLPLLLRATGSHAARDLFTTQSVNGQKPKWNILQAFVDNGIISNMHNTITGALDAAECGPNLAPYRFFIQSETYSPYPISLLSMWPLDVRQDIFGTAGKTKHLTGSHPGSGKQIGLTPHRSYQYIDGTNSDEYPLSTWNDYGRPPGNIRPRDSVNLGSQRRKDLTHLMTGSAGELAYSTKPTIFYFATSSTAFEGYQKPTASLQYNRHTFPYQTPFYATNLIRGKNPMYNSYGEFIGDELRYFGRDYTIVPEFRISDHLDYYYRYFYSQNIMERGKPTYVADIFTPPDFVADVKRTKIKRVLTHNFIAPSMKLDFLTLNGTKLTSSSGLAEKGHLQDLANSYTRYRYDHIAGLESYTELYQKRHYANEQNAVNFYERFSHTDTLDNFSRLMTHDGGYEGGLNAIPETITFKCHGIKKLLPYNGFYPVLRTMQIGTAFKNLIADRLVTSPVCQATHDEAAAIQTFLEPLFAPGVLYNSIKSGIAVDYPIYFSDALATVDSTVKNQLKDMPQYYCPGEFHASSSTAGYGRTTFTPFEGIRVNASASAAFNYGGLTMVGASRCIPAILNSKPTKRVPFEALYDLTKLNFTAIGGYNLGGLFLTTDFIDLDRCEAGSYVGGQMASLQTTAPTALVGLDSAGKPHPGRTSPTVRWGQALARVGVPVPASQPCRPIVAFSQINSPEKKIYDSMINNFLCETMEFFLGNQDDTPGVKLPVALSGQISPDGIDLEENNTLYMDVTLTMGRDHVMTEGPRKASIGYTCKREIGDGGMERPTDIFTYNSTMRGYIYGPPIETIHHSVDPTKAGGIISIGQDSVEITGSRIYSKDHESYFGANLQDPAYQAFTPPYFYGDSTVYITFIPDVSGEHSLKEITSKAEKDSFYFEEYYTGSHKGDLEALCLYIPTTGSTSEGSLLRMKIEASIDVFNDPVPIHIRSSNQTVDKIGEYWYIAPKWICPVLDFSSSIAAMTDQQTLENNNSSWPFFFPTTTITNSFHDYKTGRGMWGGYGTDPYNLVHMMEVYSEDGLSTTQINKMEKGIYLDIKEAFTDQETRQSQQAGYTTPLDSATAEEQEIIGNYYIPRKNSAPNWETGSLVRKLGFEPKKYEIGKFADSKLISEAIVVIPYLEEPIKIGLKNQSYAEQLGYEFNSAQGVPDFPGGEIYSTREIIPGKHFLPIHKTLFENVLSVALAEKLYKPGDAVYNKALGDDLLPSTRVQSVIAARSCDVGKMIETLMGDEFTSRTGYQIPPEFDFITFKNVDPFQMIVIPFEHQLTKQDLIDIYQGIMPNISTYVEKAISKVRVTPAKIFSEQWSWMPYVFSPDAYSSDISGLLDTATSVTDTRNLGFNPGPGYGGGLNPQLLGSLNDIQNNSLLGSQSAVHNTKISLNQFLIQNFLAPTPVMINSAAQANSVDFVPTTGVTGVGLTDTEVVTIQEASEAVYEELPGPLGIKYLVEPAQEKVVKITETYTPTIAPVPGDPKVLTEWIDQSTIPAWLTNNKEFYSRIRFMVFKVKQKAKKDYESYRKKQIAKTILTKAENNTPTHLVRLGGEGFTQRLSRINTREVVGSNWPYDYFSLIETIKIDVEVGVIK